MKAQDIRVQERYLRRATQGLWGQHKRDAQAELRGAIEDKLHRYALLGLSGSGAHQSRHRREHRAALPVPQERHQGEVGAIIR